MINVKFLQGHGGDCDDDRAKDHESNLLQHNYNYDS